MKQKILNGIFIIMMCLIIRIPNQSLGATSTNEYTIQSYDINMVVNEDNTFDITENITADFHVAKHGIYRKIPLKNSITRMDGTKSNNRAKITEISVSENYTISNANGYKVIKIGNANQTLKGKHSYTIRYKYNIGKDPLKNADELYFNLIGDQWDAKISNISFTITMPKSFDPSLLGFSSGNTGSANSSNVTYHVNGNTIIGNTINPIEEGQALTVRLTLPEGYFVKASSKMDMFSIFIIILCAIFVLIADRLWAKYGKDEPVVETVEFYPPEGYNSAEVGFLYKGSAETKDIISLLIYLADKGYLKIEKISNHYKQKNIELSDEKKQTANIKIQELENKIKQEKLKDINSPKIKIWENSLQIYKNIDKPIEYELSEKEESLLNKSLENSKEKFKFVKLKDYDGDNEYERIFLEGLFPPYVNKNSVTISELYNNFYITLNRIKARFNSKENKNKIFEASANAKTKWIKVMIILILTFLMVKPIVEYYEGMESSLITYIIGIISIAVLFLFIKVMPKRTYYGNEMLGKISGFKRFLETAEKSQLESLVEQNPEYFYHILPYTYALGVSDVWMNQFEIMALQAPNWYDSTDDFNVNTFSSFMTTTMDTAAVAMSSKPSSGTGTSGSGDSSGGGISGGGSGGGGGGSW